MPSSLIRAIAYDANSRVLSVWFMTTPTATTIAAFPPTHTPPSARLLKGAVLQQGDPRPLSLRGRTRGGPVSRSE